MENESDFFGGGLDIKVAIIQKSRDHAFDIGCHVLNFIQFQFTDSARKQSLLLDINNPLVRDYPDVEIIVHPDQKEGHPEKHEKKIFQKKE